MPASNVLPLFHLYGDPPDDQAFDFIHIETISSRSAANDWNIRVHRHRNLFQILIVREGGGEMNYEAARLSFEAPCAILVPATVAHGYRFRPRETEGHVITFTEDAAQGPALPPMKPSRACAGWRLIRLCPSAQKNCPASTRYATPLTRKAFSRAKVSVSPCGVTLLSSQLRSSAWRPTVRGVGTMTLTAGDPTVEALRRLLEQNFRSQRMLGFYAEKLAMTPDRLNDHVKRATGVTAGHLIRQRVLIEAKRQLVFTTEAIHEIAYDLGFSDPSHFARFFRQQTKTTPQDFRARGGG